MLYRVVVGDATQVRGVVELDIASFTVTDQGALVIYIAGAPEKVIGMWAPGRWHSIVEVQSWKQALKQGVGDENPRGRIPPRPIQAV